MAKTVAHICILVADIDRAIADYKKIFAVVSRARRAEGG